MAEAPVPKPRSAEPTEEGVMPDVCGLGLRDALWELEQRGLKVTFKGTGSVVSQSPKAGELFTPGEEAKLELRVEANASK